MPLLSGSGYVVTADGQKRPFAPIERKMGNDTATIREYNQIATFFRALAHGIPNAQPTEGANCAPGFVGSLSKYPKMFKSESSMTEPVHLWMQGLGLTVKQEFITPWGKCDLVGVSFRRKSVAHRLRLEQIDPVSSLTRAGLLMRIPEVETGKSLRLETLTREYRTLISEEDVRQHAEKLIAQKFVRHSTRNTLQRLNGWFPLHKRLMAVELKLTRIEEVLCQARNNLHFAEESYVALPSDVAQRVFLKRERWTDFFDQGVGLLSVTGAGCDVLVRSRGHIEKEPALQFYCVEKFWRRHIKGS